MKAFGATDQHHRGPIVHFPSRGLPIKHNSKLRKFNRGIGPSIHDRQLTGQPRQQ